VPIMVQEFLNRFCGVHVAEYLAFCVVICRTLLVRTSQTPCNGFSRKTKRSYPDSLIPIYLLQYIFLRLSYFQFLHNFHYYILCTWIGESFPGFEWLLLFIICMSCKQYFGYLRDKIKCTISKLCM
jgi:hypothetical protein